MIILKRAFDLIVSILALLILAPLMAGVAGAVRLKLGTPVLFRQVRAGCGGTPFQIIKFRTMLDSLDEFGNPLSDEERLTHFGLFLRSTSLDELPELLNVIMGDMSLVGPRPLLMEYLPLYSSQQARRHEVRPGITGWAQVNGRNAISWDEKFRLDVWYVDNYSMWLDLKILAFTVMRVLVRQGISSPGMATTSKFKGNG